MSDHTIPTAALDDRLGIVGTAGSGKTYTAMLLEERVLDRKGRVIHVDPLGVSWGLRLMADGKKKSPYNIVIFGGVHGDLPLTEHAGALIGETVASMAESCIIDLSQLGTKASERRFMLAFTTALYKNASGEPVHLIFDEVDMFAPQKLLDKDGDAARLLGMMETIVRRGRRLGFIPWLISQRPAVINKDILSQVDGLIAMKLTASQDRKALGAWIEGQADVDEGKKILADLPTKQKGEGVVWIPGRSILKTVQFPEKQTFDSSRAPKRGEKLRKTATLERLDITDLQEKLKAVETEVKANDPKALKMALAAKDREIAALKAAPCAPAVDPKAIEQAEQRGMARALAALRAHSKETGKRLAALNDAIERVGALKLPSAVYIDAFEDVASDLGQFAAPPVARAAQQPIPKPAPIRQPATASNGFGPPLAKAERKVLTALAQYPEGRTKTQVAILAGYAVNGGGFNNAVSRMRTSSYLRGEGENLQITQEGMDALGSYDPLPHGDALLQHWMGSLGKAERETLKVVVDVYPEAMTKEQVAEAAGYQAGGGGFNNAISRLRTLELISGRGELRASEHLFG